MRGAILAVAMLAGAGAIAADDARVVAGRDLATFLPPPGVAVENYRNAGYRLTRNADGTISVAVDLAPVESRDPLPELSPSETVNPVSVLARALVAGSRSRYEAASRVLGWVATRVGYRLDRAADQSPEAVLERRDAYCTGSARLTVALLAAVGIQAREVPGYVVEAVPGGPAAGFHRWVEVRFDDRGWIFSDPMTSHHFVPATYLRLADDSLASPPGHGALLDRRSEIREIDLLPDRAPSGRSVRVRPNDSARRAAALALRLDPAVTGRAFLEGGGQRRRLELAGGEGIFLGLEPGEYLLRVEAGGRVAARKRLTFRNRVLAELEVPVAEGMQESGRIR